MYEIILLSFRNIFRKGIRTVLTVLGISVGVASVLLINTISDIGIKTVNSELDSLGLNGISVSPENSTINNSDLLLIKQRNGVKNAVPILTSESKITQNDISEQIILWGVDSGAKQVISIDILYGRSFEDYDIQAKENVCLIDENAAFKLFGRKNVIGKSVKLVVGNSYENFEVIGVTVAGSGVLQSIMGSIVPTFCYIPYTTFQQSTGSDELYQIAVKLNDDTLAKSVSAQIKTVLDNEKGIKNSVSTGDLAAGRATLTGLLDTITVIFALVGAITLFVAGIGIMTVMLVSVNERTREIGIKKAIGASFMHIMGEFLFEALTICVIGSIIGITLGFLVIFAGGAVLGIGVEIRISSVLISFASAITVGVVFGIYPAYKAAKMKVVDALRYE